MEFQILDRVYGSPISASLVNPGDRHPLWRPARLVKGFLQFLEDFVNAIIDQREVKVVRVLAADGLRVLLQLLQGFRLQRREKRPLMKQVQHAQLEGLVTTFLK